MRIRGIFVLFCMGCVFSAAAVENDNDTMEFQRLIREAGIRDGVVRLAPKVYRIDSMTVPREITVDFVPGSSIYFRTNASIRWDGSLRAGIRKIFDGPGRLCGQPSIAKVYPQWFGALGDDRHDDGPALQKSAEFAAASMGKFLFIPEGRYRFEIPVRIASHVECRGVLVAVNIIDYGKKDTSYFLDWYHMKNYPLVRIIPDTPPVNLDPEFFYGIKRDSFKVPHYKNIPLANESGKKIELEPGGTLTFNSTDFFSARNVLKKDHVYDKLDVCRVVSKLGDVFPEFSFSYEKYADAPEWAPEKVYQRGEYVKRAGKIYKASYPSGPGISHSNRYHGTVLLGSLDPAKSANLKFKYPNEREETMMVWRLINMQVCYTPPQTPLEINGLQIEVRTKTPLSEYVLAYGSALSLNRSNVTFNRLSVTSNERMLRINSLVVIMNCTDIVFNDCMVSGANNQRGGYNILNSNVASVTYNNCTSVNARDGMAGRHGKNVTVRGGHYNVIDDHYGKNYLISGVTFHCIQPWIDGFYTPKNDPQNWYFRDGNAAVAFGGGELVIENCRVFGGNKLLSSRDDIGDFYGRITIRNISIITQKPYCVLEAGVIADFDYAHRVRVPAGVTVENVSVNHGQTLHFKLSHWNESWPLTVTNCRDIAKVTAFRVNSTFQNCDFIDADFKLSGKARVNFLNCTFNGGIKGIDVVSIGYARGVLYTGNSFLPVSENYVNPEIYRGTPASPF